MNVSHETIEASTAATQGEMITLKSNAWRACELTLRVNDSGDLECAAYAPRRAYNRFMCLAYASLVDCQVSADSTVDGSLWIGNACFTITASERKRIVEAFGVREGSV